MMHPQPFLISFISPGRALSGCVRMLFVGN
jgi:hypothetical protein